MNRVAATVLLVIAVGVSCACAQENLNKTPSQTDWEHNKWIESVLRAAQTIRVGMTRSELMTVLNNALGGPVIQEIYITELAIQ